MTGVLPKPIRHGPDLPPDLSPRPAFVTAARLSAAAVTGLDLRRLLVDAGDDLVGDP